MFLWCVVYGLSFGIMIARLAIYLLCIIEVLLWSILKIAIWFWWPQLSFEIGFLFDSQPEGFFILRILT